MGHKVAKKSKTKFEAAKAMGKKFSVMKSVVIHNEDKPIKINLVYGNKSKVKDIGVSELKKEFGVSLPMRGFTSQKARSSQINDEKRLAEDLITEIGRDTSDVKELCEKYGLRREELGRLTGFSLRALAEWAGGKLPSLPAKRRLHEVRRLLDALSGIVKPESILGWLHQPNPAFDRLTPLQVIEIGEIDRLWSMVYDLASGQPE